MTDELNTHINPKNHKKTSTNDFHSHSVHAYYFTMF